MIDELLIDSCSHHQQVWFKKKIHGSRQHVQSTRNGCSQQMSSCCGTHLRVACFKVHQLLRRSEKPFLSDINFDLCRTGSSIFDRKLDAVINYLWLHSTPSFSTKLAVCKSYFLLCCLLPSRHKPEEKQIYSLSFFHSVFAALESNVHPPFACTQYLAFVLMCWPANFRSHASNLARLFSENVFSVCRNICTAGSALLQMEKRAPSIIKAEKLAGLDMFEP